MENFQVIKQLGKGSFGTVLKVRRKEDKGIFAMKIIKIKGLSSKQKESALNEIRLLASIDASNIIKYKEAFYQDNSNALCIVMEFADGGDLTSVIEKKCAERKRIAQSQIWKVASELLHGLKFLHGNKIFHRDIKPANVFFVDGVAKLGDFNVSKINEGKYAETQTGTPYYTPPQIWEGKKYTQTCDIWSLGCLLYEMCTFSPPFKANSFPALAKRVKAGYFNPIPPQFSKKLSNLIKRCLVVDPYRRKNATQLIEMNHLSEERIEGQMQLLDTIKCPKVLRFLNDCLPERQYEQRKPKTFKLIEDEEDDDQVQSMKKVRSQKCLRPISVQRCSINKMKPQPLEPKKNNNLNNVLNSPSGYVKLPRIPSQKNI